MIYCLLLLSCLFRCCFVFNFVWLTRMFVTLLFIMYWYLVCWIFALSFGFNVLIYLVLLFSLLCLFVG